MRITVVVFCLVSACSVASAGTGPIVEKAFVDSNGRVHIHTTDGRDHIVRPEKWQAGGGFEVVKVAADGRTAGWLADQMLTPSQGGTSYSYPVALRLEIWRDGRIIRSIPAPAFAIHHWTFLKDGAEVAIHIAPPHGLDLRDSMIFDVDSGKELARWSSEERHSPVPDWVGQLFAAPNAVPE
jgi:hypothetical protein